MVEFRFNNKSLPPLQEEIPFIELLEKYANMRNGENNKLSSVVIQDQLLPLLQKIDSKFDIKKIEEAEAPDSK